MYTFFLRHPVVVKYNSSTGIDLKNKYIEQEFILVELKILDGHTKLKV